MAKSRKPHAAPRNQLRDTVDGINEPAFDRAMGRTPRRSAPKPTTFTPGPWIAPFLETAREYHVRQESKAAMPIGRVLTEGDARLVAAAPDLLAAAREFLRVAEVSDCSLPGSVSCEEWDAAKDAVRAAIAKAEGKEAARG